MAVFLAYDGSVNGDWVARYAIRAAANTDKRALSVLYAEDVSVPTPELAQKFEAITEDAAQQGVAAICEVIPARHGVFNGLIERVPDGRDTFLFCGLRIAGGRHGYLAGTVSERLLSHRRFHTLALRVVQPGLLGVARDLLAPVGDDPRGFGEGLAFLRLLAPDLRLVHVLRVMQVRTGVFRRLDASEAGRLQAEGLGYALRVEAEIASATMLPAQAIRPLVRVSDDWVKQVVIEAGRLNSDLIYLEAPRESLRQLFSFGDPVEALLRDTPCDVALYRGPA